MPPGSISAPDAVTGKPIPLTTTDKGNFMSAFSRSMAMAAAITAIMQSNNLTYLERQQKIAALPGYYSRGKGGRKRPRTFSGVARARREARKLRNKAA
jgi:hypothetical protein